MDRINSRQSQTAQAAQAEDARKSRAVVVFISAVVFWHVAVSCMVVAKAMAPVPAVVSAAR